jgi:hypothetical protein
MPAIRKPKKKRNAEKESAENKIRREQRQSTYKFIVRLTPQEKTWLTTEAQIRETSISEILKLLINRHLRCGLLENLNTPPRGEVTKETPYPMKLDHRSALKLKILSARRGVSMNQAIRMLSHVIGMGIHVEMKETSKGRRARVTSFLQPKTAQDRLLDKEITALLNEYRKCGDAVEGRQRYLEYVENKYGDGVTAVLKSIQGDIAPEEK